MPSRPRLSAKIRKLLLILLLVTAAGLRAVHLAQVAAGTPHFEVQVADCAYYDEWALDGAADTAYYQPPLYPTLLGALYAVLDPLGLLGDRFFVVAVLQSLLGIASLYLVVSIGRKLFGAAAGLLGGALFLLHPNVPFWETKLLIAPLALLLGLLSIRLLLGGVGRPRRVVLAGLAAGLLCTARADRLLFLPLAFLWTLRAGGKTRWAAAALFTISAAFPIGVVFARNLIVAGDPVLISANGGINFHFGNHPGASGLNMGPGIEFGALATQRETALRIAEAEEGRTLNDAEVAAHWFGRGLRFWREQPTEAIELLKRKATLAVADLETDIGWMAEAETPYVPLYGWLPLPFGVLLGLGLAGFLFFARRRGVLLVAAAAAASFLVLLLFFMGSRFRLPAVPSLAILGGAASLAILTDLRARRFVRPLVGVIVVGAVATFARHASDAARIPGHDTPLRELLLANTTYLVGQAFFDAGDMPGARGAFRRVLDHDPTSFKAKLALGDCAYRQAVEIEPGADDAERARLLGIAERNYGQARVLFPTLPDVHERLGDVALDPASRDPDTAVPHYEEALRLSGGAPEVHAKLVRALLLGGREAEARQALDAFERQHPDHPRARTLRLRLSRP